MIRRPPPDPDEVAAVARLLAAAEQPLIIAGGGVIYSDADRRARGARRAAGIPVAETFAGKGAVQQRGVVAAGRHRAGGHPGHQRAGRTRPTSC